MDVYFCIVKIIDECSRPKDALFRGKSRAAATSKMERFVMIVNGWKLEAVNYYHKVLHIRVAVALDLPLLLTYAPDS